MDSNIRGEINWRFWQELDPLSSLTTSTAHFSEDFLPHFQTPWTMKCVGLI